MSCLCLDIFGIQLLGSVMCMYSVTSLTCRLQRYTRCSSSICIWDLSQGHHHLKGLKLFCLLGDPSVIYQTNLFHQNGCRQTNSQQIIFETINAKLLPSAEHLKLLLYRYSVNL